jgi:DNA repair photolyase
MVDLAKDARALRDHYGDAVPEILISFIGDAYQPAEKTLGKTRLVIKTFINAGLPFTILTKSHIIRRDHDILAPYRSKFRLGMTIISGFDDELTAWEPGASCLAERLMTLKQFSDSGVRTWVSLEPIMKIMSAVKLIKNWHKYVDEWHVGKLNHGEPPEPIDWMEAVFEIQKALDEVGATYKFKKSLTDL